MEASQEMKCKICKTKFEPRFFLQKACFDPVCLDAWSQMDKQKTIKKVEAITSKANKKAVRDLDRRSLPWQHKQTQPVFNKLRRLQELKWFSDRDLEPVCTSCRKPLGKDQWCNGHFKSVGANGRLRYDFKNSYLQHNNNCNNHRSGDATQYEIGLVDRFGEEEGREIISYCEENNSPIKRTWQELEVMRKEFNKQIKMLE